MKTETLLDAAYTRLPSASGRKSEMVLHKQPALSLEFEFCGNVMVLHCHGRIIFRGENQRSETRGIWAIVAEVLPSANRMIVNLEGVDSIDSGGLGEMVMTQMWADAAGYILKFASPNKSVRYRFEVTNLLSIFEIYASVPEAMEAMGREEVQTA